MRKRVRRTLNSTILVACQSIVPLQEITFPWSRAKIFDEQSSAWGITQKEGRGVDFQLLMFMNNIPLRLGINIYRGVMWII